jgi:AcrR family transcriptional regulator
LVPEPPRKTRRDHNSDATRQEIVLAATRLFGQHGYAATPLSAIVEAASVTTGAVYHHFGDKQGLFRAVAEAVEGEILQRITAAGTGQKTLWEVFVTGTLAMLDICAEPHIQQIAFIDAPNVLGAAQWRETEKRYAFGLLHQVLDGLKQSGAIRIGSTEIVASILLGAAIEAATAVARDPAAIDDARAIMLRLLDSLRS